MIFARFRHRDRVSWGIVQDSEVQPIEGDIYGDYKKLSEKIPLADVQLLAPAQPRKIVAAAVNYQSHVVQSRRVLKQDEAPKTPELFLKPSTAIIGPGDPIILPKDAGQVDYEGEVVAVIGRVCRNVSPEQALDYIFAYTCGNDVSAREWQRKDIQWWRAKGSDTFAPVGPWLVTGLDPTNLDLRTLLNGEEVQTTNTKMLVHSIAKLVSFTSSVMTLEPGDLIYTGTPGQTRAISAGDTVAVEVKGIGVLSNPVKA